MQKLSLKKHSAFFCVALAVLTAAVLRQIGFYVNEQLDLLCNIRTGKKWKEILKIM